MKFAAATASMMTLVVLAAVAATELSATPRLVETSTETPITPDNCMAFSPARRAASGVVCRPKQPIAIELTNGAKSTASVAAVANPILFVTQVPTAG